MRYHYTSIRITKISKTDNTKSLQGCGATVTLTYCLSDTQYTHPGNHPGSFLRI